MRGMLILVLAGIIMLAGCAGQQPPAPNASNNTTNVTPPVVAQCSGPVCGMDGKTYPTDCDASIANVSVNFTGECPPEPQCIASVEGIKLDVVGTVVKGQDRRTDKCLNSSTVAKFNCDNNSIVEIDLPCGDNKTCSNGACIALPPQPPANNTTNVTPPIPSGCVGPSQPDFTSGSNITYNGVAYNATCNDIRTAKAFYCSNNTMQLALQSCDSGYACDRGVCKLQQYICTDSDHGTNLTVVGRTTVSTGFNTIFDKTDECKDDQILKEYDCSANGSGVENDIWCPINTKCAFGVCVKSNCNETVAWNDTSTGGVTISSSDNIKHFDYCIDDRSLFKYFCYGDSVDSRTITCPAGYICNLDTNGCIPGSHTTTTTP